MKSHFFKTACFFVSLIVLMSCAGSSKKNPTPDKLTFSSEFINASYRVLSFGEQKTETQDLSIIISPEQNLITGFSGCNNFQYTYTLDGEKLNLGRVITSDMYCEDTKKLENDFLSQFSKSNRFAIYGDQLFLMNENKEVLIKAEKIEK